jgi:purine nucleosidase
LTRKLLIDTDTASDDAVALIMALREPQVDVVAITVVSGNVPVDLGVRNALYTVELCGAATPVFRGAEAPLLRPTYHSWAFHGRDGLGDMNYPPPAHAPAPGHAVDALIDAVRANPGITLVTLGPLTNIALALRRAPEMASQIVRCVVMGGVACTVGNVTPAAEFNVWCDPDAARAVFHSGMPVEMVGWELSRFAAALDREDMATIRALGTPLAGFALDCNRITLEAHERLTGEPALDLPDPVAMAVALEPEICTRKGSHYVDVETESDLTRGMVVIDALDTGDQVGEWPEGGPLVSRTRKIDVCWQIDPAAFKRRLLRALG